MSDPRPSDTDGALQPRSTGLWPSGVPLPSEKEQPMADVPEPTAEDMVIKLDVCYWGSRANGVCHSAIRRAIHAERQLDAANARIAELEEMLFCAGQDDHKECLELIAKEQRAILAALQEVAARDARIVELEKRDKDSSKMFLDGVHKLADADELLAARDARIAKLESWKESALGLLPLQEWGQELGLPLGSPIHDAILPALKKLADLRDLIREKDAALEPFANAAEAEEGDWMCDNNRRAKAALERKETVT